MKLPLWHLTRYNYHFFISVVHFSIMGNNTIAIGTLLGTLQLMHVLCTQIYLLWTPISRHWFGFVLPHPTTYSSNLTQQLHNSYICIYVLQISLLMQLLEIKQDKIAHMQFETWCHSLHEQFPQQRIIQIFTYTFLAHIILDNETLYL